MEVLKAFKFRLDLSKAEEEHLRKCCTVRRYAWNWTVATCKAEYEAAVEEAKARDDFTMVPSRKDKTKEFKKWNAKAPSVNYGRLYSAFLDHHRAGMKFVGTPDDAAYLSEDSHYAVGWLGSVRGYHSHVYSYPIKDVCLSYAAWWRALKRGGKRAGPPKFKVRGKCKDSFRIQINVRSLGKKKIRIPGVGWLKTRRDPLERIGDGKPMVVTVSRVADHWYASVAAKVEISEPNREDKPQKVVGVDLGLNALVTLSDGTRISPPQTLERNLKKLARLQRQMSRKEKGSNRRMRAQMRVARLHEKIANSRADFLHRLSRGLVNGAQVIVVEGFDIQKLLSNVDRRVVRRKISDAAWGELRRQLDYKGNWYGSDLVVHGEFEPTDMQCHRCGTLNKMSPRTSEYRCSGCKLAITRQQNTALLLKTYGEGNPLPTSERNAK